MCSLILLDGYMSMLYSICLSKSSIGGIQLVIYVD